MRHRRIRAVQHLWRASEAKTRGLKSSFDEPHTHSGLDFVFTVETFPDHLTLSSHG
jgi:hypothetical protein